MRLDMASATACRRDMFQPFDVTLGRLSMILRTPSLRVWRVSLGLHERAV